MLMITKFRKFIKKHQKSTRKTKKSLSERARQTINCVLKTLEHNDENVTWNKIWTMLVQCIIFIIKYLPSTGNILIVDTYRHHLSPDAAAATAPTGQCALYPAYSALLWYTERCNDLNHSEKNEWKHAKPMHKIKINCIWNNARPSHKKAQQIIIIITWHHTQHYCLWL